MAPILSNADRDSWQRTWREGYEAGYHRCRRDLELAQATLERVTVERDRLLREAGSERA